MLGIGYPLHNRTREHHLRCSGTRLVSPKYEATELHVNRPAEWQNSGFRVCLGFRATPSVVPPC